MSAWSPQDEFILRRLYATTSNAEIGQIVGRAPRNVGMKARKMGLSKSPEYMATAGRIQPGAVPHNKGLRRPGWAPGRMAKTQFKKGRPAREARNYQPIGTERITRDGILERKVTDDPSVYPARRWVPVSRLVWEATNGAIPPGHAVAFLPGRKTTDADRITLDALELVSRAELMRRNTRHRFPPELNQLLALKAALTRKINNRSKKREEQDQ